MAPDNGNPFQSFTLSNEETQMAVSVSPYFLAYLQNKIAVYAVEAATRALPYHADPTAQVEAVLAHQRTRNFVEAYQELLAELMDAQSATQSN